LEIEKEEDEENKKKPPVEFYLRKESWVHFTPNILK